MNEAFLYHIWKFRLFNQHNLMTTDGQPLHILKTGSRNDDSGPDFFNARIKAGDTEWAGNVEIDVTSADWYLHGHDKNDAFAKIILHVVYEVTKPLHHNFPVLELKNYLYKNLIIRYNNLQQSTNTIPCKNQLPEINNITLNSWLERLLIERAEEKSKGIEISLKENKLDWEITFYHFLARNFGFKTNALPFEMLAKNLPLPALAKQKDNLLQVEALLFGQAGFLEDKSRDNYFNQLKKEYLFLSQKYALSPLQKSIWKFARLHPANFPTVRIAQFASLIHKSSHLFSKVIETDNNKDLLPLFDVTPSEYWLNHYHFEKASDKKSKSLGQSSAENILINTVVPFLFVYGKLKKNDIFRERALSLLEKIKPENNIIIRDWRSAGIKAEHAWHTQALIQLRNNYCNKKQCLNCAIGLKILKTNE